MPFKSSGVPCFGRRLVQLTDCLDITHADPIRLSLMHLRGKMKLIPGRSAELASTAHALQRSRRSRRSLPAPTKPTPRNIARNEVVRTAPSACSSHPPTSPNTCMMRRAAGAFGPSPWGRLIATAFRLVRDLSYLPRRSSCIGMAPDEWPEREFEAAHIAPQQAWERYEEDAWEEERNPKIGWPRQLGYEFTVTEVAMGVNWSTPGED